MTYGQPRKAVQRQTFHPFTISLADGRQFRVRSPGDVLARPDAQRTFIVAETGEDDQSVDLLLVTSIDFAKQNGKSRPRRRRSGS